MDSTWLQNGLKNDRDCYPDVINRIYNRYKNLSSGVNVALVVIIEDEEDLLNLLEFHLQREGYRTFAALSTKPVERLLAEERPDLMIVDRNLPGVEGSKFVYALRQKGIDIPVIFLSAKSASYEIEEGFLRGGDDYITKPFNMKELLYRVKALLKRTKPQEREEIRYKDILLKPKSYEVFIEGEPVELTTLEFKLLLELMINKNVVLTRKQLLERVWGEGECNERNVNVAINRLKDKIDPHKKKNYIKAIRGVGYQLS